jgi:hypothetical protein
LYNTPTNLAAKKPQRRLDQQFGTVNRNNIFLYSPCISALEHIPFFEKIGTPIF